MGNGHSMSPRLVKFSFFTWLGIFVLRGLSALFQIALCLCRGTVDGQIICHNFLQPSISPSCRPTSDLGSQWKGEDLAQDP